MKLLKSWKLMFLLSLIIIYSMFGVNVFSQASKLPSDDFSRHIELAEIKTGNFQDSRNASTITALDLENGKIGVLYYDTTLNYIELSNSAKVLKKVDLNLSFDDLRELNFRSVDEDSVSFYTVDGSDVYNYTVNTTTNVVDKKIISRGAKSIRTSRNYLTIILKNGYSILKDTGTSLETIYESEHSPRNMSNLVDNGDLSFSYLAIDENGVQKLWYYNFTNSNKSSIITNITTIPSNGNYSTSSISIVLDGNLISILHEGTDYKTGTSTLTIYKENPNVIFDELFTKTILNGLKSADGSILISSSDNNFEFVTRVPNKESDSEIAHDIYLFGYDNYKLTKAKKLTKSGGNSSNPNYIQTDSSNFLIWTDSIGLNKSILIAGDNEDIINTSYKLSKNDMTQVFMDITFTLSPTLFSFMLPLLSIAGPIIFILIIMSFVNLTYLERNGKRILAIIIGFHIILKFYFIYNTLFGTLPHMRELLPLYISNIYILLIYMIILTAISLWINYLKNPKFLEGRDIWMNYISFMLIDILIVWLAIMPYLYMWLDVSSSSYI
ncbi:MAG: hypothetical protein WBA54_14420 [Acidaminobacteraceae bacterium]